MIDITNYTDYVAYLNDLVRYKKTNGVFSFRRFCRRSGFRSPSYLKWILDGKRPISLKSVDKFAVGLGLNERETHRLQLMVHYHHSQDPRMKAFFLQEILKV